jgi:beta-phosphoglucomutase
MQMESMIKGAVFDMDGTLVDNMHFHQKAWSEFLGRYDINMTVEEYNRKNTGTITDIVPRFFPQVSDPAEIIRLGMEKEQLYRDLYRGHVEPLPGLKTFLTSLREAGISLALATAADKGNIDFTIDALGIRDFFGAITGWEDVERGKPHPDVYLKSAQKLGLNPADCMAFEDSMSGIRSALAAGMKVIGLATTHNREELADLPLYAVIDHYDMKDPVGFLNK